MYIYYALYLYMYTMIYINKSVSKSDKMSVYSSTSWTVACDEYLKEYQSGEIYSETPPLYPPSFSKLV